MLRLSRARPAGALLALGLSACFFPDYTFKNQGGGGATSSSSASSTGSGGMGGGGGMGPVEDCFNGVDDDQNGLADCADPACTPVTECVGAIPVGWGAFGYVVLGETDPASAPMCPSYATTSKYTGNASLMGGSWSCTQCKCDPPAGESCDLTHDLNAGPVGIQAFQVFDTPNCTNPTTIKNVSIPGTPPSGPWWDLTCTATDTLASGAMCGSNPCNTSVFADFPTVSGGSCAAKGGTPNLSTPSWGVAATVCGNVAAMAGCGAEDKCMPKPAAPFEGHVCVGKAGDQTCPAVFTKKHLYYGGLADTRGCAPCGCGDPSGSVCEITIKLHSDDACAINPPIATFTAGSCANLTGNPRIGGREASVTQAPNGGSCTPTVSNPMPTGSLTESTPTTFCCLP